MRILNLLIFLIILPAQSIAATVTVEFGGTVRGLISGSGQGLFGAPGTVSVDDAFTGRFVYETGSGNPDQLAADNLRGVYTLTSFELDGSALSFDGGLIGVTLGLPSLAPLPPAPDVVEIRLNVPLDPYTNGVRLRFAAPNGTLPGDALPDAFNLGVFSEGARLSGVEAFGLAPFPNIEDVGTITAMSSTSVTSEVPLPAGLPLLLAGLSALLLGRRRI